MTANRLEFAVGLAKHAGQNTLQYFQKDNFQVEMKEDSTPVTIADRSTELLLRKRIETAFEDDGILGEEFPEKRGKSGYRWILDPIDGTKAFIHGVPLYGTLIGIEYNGKPLIGVIRMPALDETVYAQIGKGAWYVKGEKPPVAAKVSATQTLSEALVLTSEQMTFYQTNRHDRWERLLKASQQARTWGDCYGYLLVATGRADVMVDPEMSLWDAAALLPIIQEAGGLFTDWTDKITPAGGDGIATNGVLHDQVMDILLAP
ncbi:MAG: histidinol-phosphatase [Planctomycetia bacterium]|nr:histidinol-phosphatase [Planctomycetia bacterium]